MGAYTLVVVLAAIGLVLPSAAADAAAQPLVITTTDLPDARVGVAYNTPLKASGGNFGRVWSLTGGSLPTGLNLSPQGRITGTPQADGPATFTVSVHDTANPQQTATAVVDLTVSPMQITTAALPDATVGYKYQTTQLMVAGGVKPYVWSLTAGNLPMGLTLSSSGQITGAVGIFSGTSSLTVQVTDKAGRTAAETFTIVVHQMEITTASSLPGATKNR